MNNAIGKEQTIGCEIEFCKITRTDAAKKIAEYFHTTPNHTGGNYDTWEIKDQQGRIWKVVSDSSIQDTPDKRCELVTPILRFEDIEILQEVARQIRHAGGKSGPEYKCGVHLHIGADGHTAQTLRNLTNLMASHEALLTESLKIDKGRIDSYCRTVDPDFLSKINSEKPKTMTALKKVWYNGGDESYMHYSRTRYHMLNLHAVFTKGTVEFRLFQFNNGIHAGELKSWIYLCMALSNMAKNLKSASPKQVQRDNDKYAMRCWLLRLGFIGDEFKTAREHLLKGLTGDSAFRNGRPAA
ncbi:MAG: amidoligase family protein [Eubacteriales bacterium]